MSKPIVLALARASAVVAAMVGIGLLADLVSAVLKGGAIGTKPLCPGAAVRAAGLDAARGMAEDDVALDIPLH
jgi:hypothetical protein